MVKRKKYTFRKGDIVEIEENHDGNYGRPGENRTKKVKPTPEQMQKVNALNKAKRCRHRLLEYFAPGDLFVTLTYDPTQRPKDMEGAKNDFAGLIKSVRKEYKKSGTEFRWIRNIEQGTRGAWHIHMVIKNIAGAVDAIRKAWVKGGIYSVAIQLNDKIYDEDFTKLANYMTKDEHTTEIKADGTQSKPRIRQASYSTSRNMPLPEPEVDKLVRWKPLPKPNKGYYIAKIHEGFNPVTGFMYRRYTMIKLQKRGDSGETRGKPLHSKHV